VQLLEKIAQSRDQSIAQLAIAWVLRKKQVTSALIGASRVDQIEEIVATLNNLDLSDDELEQIEKILKD
jgi:L-glyceraldehyde 3-phosphate reductase